MLLNRIKWIGILKKNLPHLFFIFMAFFLMVLVSYYSVSGIVHKNLLQRAEESLRTAEESIRATLMELEISMTNSLLTVRDMLDRGASQEEITIYLSETTRRLQQQESYSLKMYGIYGYIRGEFINSIGLESGISFVLQRRPWYQAAIRSRRGIAYTQPYVDMSSGELIISAVQNVYNEGGINYGILGIDIDIAGFGRYISSRKLSEGGYGLLLNQYMTIITHPQEHFLGKQMQELGGEYQKIQDRLLNKQPIAALRIDDLDGISKIVFFRQIFNGWYIGLFTPFRTFYQDMYTTAGILIILGFILMSILSGLHLHLSLAKLRSDNENKFKSSFLAQMSHEIRTPLNGILGLTDVELQKQLPEHTRLNLEKIHTSGLNLLGIINDILDISKIEAGSFELIPVEYAVPSLINDAVQLNILRIGSKPISFELVIDETFPSRLYGDELRIKQILNNLLSNAFKYTKAGRVTLEVGYKWQDREFWVHAVVGDTGIGIKQEDLCKLFTEYTQVDTRVNRAIEGTGLGLSITKRLLDLMGGNIRVESEYGKGSRFTLQFPQKIMEEAPIGKETAENLRAFRFLEDRCNRNRERAPFQLPSGRVLVVDDVEINLEVAKGMMESYGLQIDCVTSGQEAVDRIREAAVPYHIIFMDQMMPQMDGVEAVRIIRNEIGTPYAKSIPIIALTANALVGNEEMFLANGFNGFISKPIDILRLEETLKRWIPPHEDVLECLR